MKLWGKIILGVLLTQLSFAGQEPYKEGFSDVEDQDLVYGLAGLKDHINFKIVGDVTVAHDQDGRMFLHRGKAFDSYQLNLQVERRNPNPIQGQFGWTSEEGDNLTLKNGMRRTPTEFMQEAFCMVQFKPTDKSFIIRPSKGPITLKMKAPTRVNPGVDIFTQRRDVQETVTNLQQIVFAVKFDVSHSRIDHITCSRFWDPDLQGYVTYPLTYSDIKTALLGGKDAACVEEQFQADVQARQVNCVGDEVYEYHYGHQPYRDSPIVPVIKEEFTVYEN